MSREPTPRHGEETSVSVLLRLRYQTGGTMMYAKKCNYVFFFHGDGKKVGV